MIDDNEFPEVGPAAVSGTQRAPPAGGSGQTEEAFPDLGVAAIPPPSAAQPPSRRSVICVLPLSGDLWPASCSTSLHGQQPAFNCCCSVGLGAVSCTDCPCQRRACCIGRLHLWSFRGLSMSHNSPLLPVLRTHESLDDVPKAQDVFKRSPALHALQTPTSGDPADQVPLWAPRQPRGRRGGAAGGATGL